MCVSKKAVASVAAGVSAFLLLGVCATAQLAMGSRSVPIKSVFHEFVGCILCYRLLNAYLLLGYHKPYLFGKL